MHRSPGGQVCSDESDQEEDNRDADERDRIDGPNPEHQALQEASRPPRYTQPHDDSEYGDAESLLQDQRSKRAAVGPE